jgi:uncharacterized protein (TIRG00374 family)
VLAWIAPLVAIVALAWTGRNVNWSAAFAMVGTLGWKQIFLILAFPLTYYAVAAWRLGTILRYLGAPIRFRTMLELTIASFAASYLLPSLDLAGKSVKFAILGTKERVEPEKIIPALSVEAIVGSGTDLLMRALLFFLLGLTAFLHQAILKIALGVSITLALFFFLPLVPPAIVRRFIRKEKTRSLYERMRMGFLRLISTPRQLAALIGISVVSFTLGFTEIKIATALVGIPLDAKALFLVFTAFHTAWIIPTPGGIGTVEGALAGIFWTLGGNPLWGIAIAIAFRLKEFVWVFIGLVLLAKNGIRIFKTNGTP